MAFERSRAILGKMGLSLPVPDTQVDTPHIVDVLISQQQLLSAQSSYSQARHAFVLNGLRLKQSAGVIQVSDLEAVNALLE